MQTFLKITGLSLALNKRRILDNINLKALSGSCTVICGPSGSGKSSLLRCINLLNDFDEGSIVLDNHNIHDIPKTQLRKKVGMVFQQYNLFDHLTVLENCTLALRYAHHLKSSQAKDLAGHYLKQVKMQDHQISYPRQLSGGQQQRVAIARAMCLQPQLLLLDEPTAALDPEMSYEVLETIKSLAEQGVTMLYVTHEMNVARQIAHQVAFLENGKIIEVGSPEEILVKPKNTRIQRFIDRVAHQLEK